MRIQNEVVTLFRVKVQPSVSEDTKLDILLSYEESPIILAKQVARDYDASHKTVLKILNSSRKQRL